MLVPVNSSCVRVNKYTYKAFFPFHPPKTYNRFAIRSQEWAALCPGPSVGLVTGCDHILDMQLFGICFLLESSATQYSEIYCVNSVSRSSKCQTGISILQDKQLSPFEITVPIKLYTNTFPKVIPVQAPCRPNRWKNHPLNTYVPSSKQLVKNLFILYGW